MAVRREFHSASGVVDILTVMKCLSVGRRLRFESSGGPVAHSSLASEMRYRRRPGWHRAPALMNVIRCDKTN